MELLEVNDTASRKAFFELPKELYRNDPNFICPLRPDVERVFDKEKNRKFRKGGEAIRWLLQDEGGRYIGRIAAFIDPNNSFSSKVPCGGMGFFECINEQKAANMLFDKAKEWLSERGMQAMDGPVNFGERNQWWGLLVDGFMPPSYCMNYNPPYYIDLFEQYGFKCYFKQFTYYREVATKLHQKFRIKAEAAFADPDFRFEHIRKKNIPKLINDFRTVYNKAWGSKHEGFKEMNERQATAIINGMKPVIDERIIYFGYYKEEPIAFFVCLPELNQIVKHLNGNFNLWAKLKFWYMLKTQKSDRMFGVIFGVAPEYHGKGIEGALITAAHHLLKKGENEYLYKDIEMTWIGDFNPKMLKVVDNLGATVYKTHITYRKLFDENQVFERYPILD